MTDEIKKLQEDNEQKKKALVERMQKEAESVEKVLEIAAHKLVEKVMNKNSLYSEENLQEDLIKIVKSIAARDIIDRLLDHMSCPMLTKPNWPYCTGCEKGKEIWCHSIKFLECPAFSQYRAHELVTAPKRKVISNKEKVAKKKE
jgi:hypothetical protein